MIDYANMHYITHHLGDEVGCVTLYLQSDLKQKNYFVD